MNELTYRTSKKQVVVILLLCAIFVFIGIWIIQDPGSYFRPSPYVMGVVLLVLTAGIMKNKNHRIRQFGVKVIGVIAGLVILATLLPVGYVNYLWGGLTIVFFGGGGLFYLLSMFRRKHAVLRLTSTTISVGNLYSYTIAWDKLQELRVTAQHTGFNKPTYQLALIPKTGATDLPAVRGLFTQKTAEMLGSPYIAVLNQASAKPQAIIEEIRTFLSSNSIGVPLVVKE